MRCNRRHEGARAYEHESCGFLIQGKYRDSADERRKTDRAAQVKP